MARSTPTEGTAAESQPQTVVYLGNRKAVVAQDGERTPVPGKRCTTVVLPEDATLMSAFYDITGPAGLWTNMSDAPAPAWVAASGPLADSLTKLLSAQYPGVEIREPDPNQEG